MPDKPQAPPSPDTPAAPKLGHAKLGPARPGQLVRRTLRRGHFSPRTEKAYVGWIRRYILFHGKRHPDEMGGPRDRRFPHAPGPEPARQRIDAEPGL